MWPPELAHRAPLHDFPPAWASAWGDDRYGLWADLEVNGVVQRLRWIEPSMPGGFLMGSTQKERDAIEHKDIRERASKVESEPRLVEITSGFWLANTPCTQAFWLAVVGGNNPSRFQEGDDAPRRPVERVPFLDDMRGAGVRGFLQALNQHLPEPRAVLPSEAEWEYACRADTTTAYWWGDTFDSARANVRQTDEKGAGYKESTNPVDHYPPNPWGLHDMHGNVREWCSDPWQQRPGKGDPEKDSFVVRGGSWNRRPSVARAAYRSSRPTDAYHLSLGFRFTLRSPSPVPQNSA
jgi:formylglycine-generating enzyme